MELMPSGVWWFLLGVASALAFDRAVLFPLAVGLARRRHG